MPRLPWWYVFRQTEAKTANISHLGLAAHLVVLNSGSLVHRGGKPTPLPLRTIEIRTRVAGRWGRIAAAHSNGSYHLG
jgi:hypothetical protein